MKLDQTYWDNRYQQNETGWDLGYASPPLIHLFKKIKDTGAAILIPGCGNAYEAEYLAEQGYNNIILLDISPIVAELTKKRFSSFKAIKIICQDFFEHHGHYDYIIEQTFFCALNPNLRDTYVTKINELLKPSGKLMGVLFNREFDKEGPPFGGNIIDYKTLFESKFNVEFKESQYSIEGRNGFEVEIIATPK